MNTTEVGWRFFENILDVREGPGSENPRGSTIASDVQATLLELLMQMIQFMNLGRE